jgi:hypothetical protein
MPTLTLTIHPAQMRIPDCAVSAKNLWRADRRRLHFGRAYPTGISTSRCENTLNEMTELTPRGDCTAICDAK